MLIQVKKSKIHRATITEANLNYMGSIAIDEHLIEAANLYEGERVQVLNINNGERLETYVIKGERGTGVISINGAAARKMGQGDKVIIISYAFIDAQEHDQFTSVNVFPDEQNRIH
ncbi:MAG: aspartate 1-decarboxylase [Bacteroidota bacterium]